MERVSSQPKPSLPIDVLEALGEITQQTRRILDSCVEPFPFPALILDWKKVTQIMKASATKRYRKIEEFYRSQPGFRPEWLAETVADIVEEVFESVPIRFRMGSRFKDHVPAIREGLKAELHLIITEPRPEKNGASTDRPFLLSGQASDGTAKPIPTAAPPERSSTDSQTTLLDAAQLAQQTRAQTVARLIRELNNLKPQMFEDETEYNKLRAQYPDFLAFEIADNRPDLKRKILAIRGSIRHIRLAQELAAAHHGKALATIVDAWKDNKPTEFKNRP